MVENTPIRHMVWFCGANVSERDRLHPLPSDLGGWVYNACSTDLAVTGVHIAFCILASLSLLFVICSKIGRSSNQPYLIRYPGHEFRWLVYILYFIVCLTMLGEGILTEVHSWYGYATMPRLYVAPITALLACVLAMVYYHHMEYWNLPYLAPLQFLYWFFLLATECGRFVAFYQDPEVDLNQLRWDLNIAVILLATLLCMVEMHVLRKKVFACGRDVEEEQPSDLRNPRMHFYDDYCNLPSSVVHSWMDALFKLGYKRPLEMADLGCMSRRHSVRYNNSKFAKIMAEEEARAKATGGRINLYRAFWRASYVNIIKGGIIKFLSDTSTFATPYMISGAIRWASARVAGDDEFEEPTKYITWYSFFENGFVLIAALFIQTVLQKLGVQHHYNYLVMESNHGKATIQAAVYRKSLRLSGFAINGGAMTMGQITNHMSVDPICIFSAVEWLHSGWSVPYLIAGYLIILYYHLGFAALVGSTVFIISVPVQTYFAQRQAKYQKQAMSCADNRLKKTNEMLQGIKAIKLYAWENIFLTAIGGARGAEIAKQITQMIWKVLLNGVTNAAPLLAMLVSYSLYTTISGNALTPEVTFAAFAVFNQITLPMLLLPRVVTCYVTAVVSIRRLTTYFHAPEVEEKDDGRRRNRDFIGYNDNSAPPGYQVDSKVLWQSEKPQPTNYGTITKRTALLADTDVDDTSKVTLNIDTGKPSRPPLPDEVMLKVTDGAFTWDINSTTPCLSSINMQIPTGQLTMIVGQVGAGKSSLLSAILGEMKTLHGDVHWNSDQSTIAYAAQKAWLINASLKDNILFGNPYMPDRYRQVISACCLQPDIDILPDGDQTEIGEKGINLSGGQKQRISVARAMYSFNNVVVLDDPLSALDVHVGGHMFFNGIMEFLIESHRTVILVTHQIQYLEHADLIIYMKDGLIARKGTMKEIKKEDPGLALSWNIAMTEISESEVESEYDSSTADERRDLERRVKRKKQDRKKEAAGESSSLIKREERLRGSVVLGYYWYYLKVFGPVLGFLIMLVAVLQNAAQAGTNFWLSAWSEAGEDKPNMTTEEADAILQTYLGGYCGLSITNIILNLVWNALLLIGSLFASRKMHQHMLKSIIHAPLRFFDTTPIGRVLNRFSADMQVLDQKMGLNLVQVVKYSLAILAGIIVNSIISWYFVAAITPVVIFYIFLMRVYIASSRELQRLESITRSPVFAFFSESLGGLSTIRAYNLETRFLNNILAKIETNNTALIYRMMSNRWLGVRLDTIGALVVLIAGLTSLTASVVNPGLFGASLAGLAITYALLIASQLNWLIRYLAEVEMGMNAVERISYYSQVESENYSGSVIPESKWPEDGQITYQNVHARYAKELDPVLHGVSIHFKAGEKIGICGRTGSGKSSLTLTLFRIIDTFKGSIMIDGLDIARLPLKELRKRLAIIPQDPVLFTGTIRFNLDPLGDRTDEEIWEALEIAQLKPIVTELNLGLDSGVSEGGENFSVGQRQLFCLARAFLRQTRILVMDEATASIDFETDAILQEVVSTAFEDRTVITIAHRVSTIMDSDHILVLDKGHVAEYGSPTALLAKDNGIFASLVQNNQ